MNGRAVVYDAVQGRWLQFHRPEEEFVARRPGEVLDLLAAVERGVEDQGLAAAGFVAYEAAPAMDAALAVRAAGDFPLAWFGLYRRAEPIDLPPPPAAPLALDWAASIDENEYARAIARIRQYIAAGDTYQVNYSYRLTARFDGDPWGLFLDLVAAQGCGQAAYIEAGDWAIASASPELFFRRQGSQLWSRPMKGTAARGLSQAEDLRQAAWLRASEKNRAENVMIVDMVRNDVGSIARPGTVSVARLFEIEKYPSLWQMTSTVSGTTEVGLAGLFRAMFPAASITGAPKARTTEIIAELETTPRRIYTGSIGFVTPGRVAQFNVAIRTVLVDRRAGGAEYGVGGGIVWDSQAGAEWQECRTKARVLAHPRTQFDLLETLRWTPGEGFFLLERHLARLAGSADYFARPLDVERVRQALDAAAAAWYGGPRRVRLTVSAGGEPRVESAPLEPLPLPYRVRVARRAVDSSDVFLYHKTTWREVYRRALAETPGCDDVLLTNERGELTESTIANLIVELDGRLVTPPVRCGLLAGTLRAQMIEAGRVVERVVTVDDLHRASAVHLANSLRGTWRPSHG